MINRFEQGPFPGKCTVHGSAYWPDTTLAENHPIKEQISYVPHLRYTARCWIYCWRLTVMLRIKERSCKDWHRS